MGNPPGHKELVRPAYYWDLVNFFADASDQRTLKQFALDHGVAEDAIHSYRFRHDAEIYADVEKLRAKYIPKLRAHAWKSVFANVAKNFNDRKLALQLTGDLVETTRTSLELKTPEEKRAAIAQLMAGLSARMSGHDDALPANPPKDEAGQ